MHSGNKMREPRGKIKRKLLYCPHCAEIVTKSTYYRHKSKFYNKDSKTWMVVHDESVLLSSTNSSDSSEDYSVHYIDECVIHDDDNDDGDAGEELV